MNHTRIYFDHAATSPLLDEVKLAMEPYFSDVFGNASSPYAVAREARMAVDMARTEVAKLIGAHADEIAWTAGGTEADNWALLGVAFANLELKGHFVISQIEHHAVLEPAKTLRELGFEVDFAQPNADGVVEASEIEKLIRPDTLLVSLMSVNNETGVVQPIGEVAALCEHKNVLFHVDATQSAGKMHVDVDQIDAEQTEGENSFPIDLLTISAHKIGGPKGVGALYIRRGTKMKPLIRGGAQERGRRAGTENVAGIVGFAAASKIARKNLSKNSAHLNALKSHLEAGLRAWGNVQIVGENATRAPHISSFIFGGKRAESLALSLDLGGIALGTGSACASGALEPSHVLGAMGFSAHDARSTLRVSFGVSNSIEEVDEFLATLRKNVAR